MKYIPKILGLLLSFFLLSSCGSRTDLAPVIELKWQPQNPHSRVHIVRRGETLYAVAFRYDQDYRHLAEINHLRSPYSLRVGQVLRLRSGSQIFSSRQYRPAKSPNALRHYPARRSTAQRPTSRAWPLHDGYQHWLWPVRGHIATGFVPNQGKKGIDIAGRKGDRIHAASDGVVAYAGNGLTGYGNLIIIKHNNNYLTAYGNNLHNLVREGQKVKAGQIIADMGIIDRRFWGVHFEIRQSGRPVNPLSYLRRS